MATEAILDASAVLAAFNQEPGAEFVASLFGRAGVSTVNLAEVLSRLSDLGSDPLDAMKRLERAGLAVIPFDESQAVAAGSLRTQTRRLGLSLGDRACLAAAMALDVPVVTADRAWRELNVTVEIVVIR